MPFKIQLPLPMPFEKRLFGAPYQGQELLLHPAPQSPLFEKNSIVVIKKCHLALVQEFLRDAADARGYQFDIHAHPAIAAHYGGGKSSAMRNGKMIGVPFQVWLPRICNPDLFHRKIREKMGQEEPARQMLSSFERV